jgi:hypothetical protein
VDWTIEDGAFRCEVEVPVNTQATIQLATSDAKSIRVEGKGYEYLGQQDGRESYRAGSGTYVFTGLK